MRNNRWVRRVVMAGGVLLLIGAIIYGVTGSFPFSASESRQNWPARFESNGERIYFSAASASGAPITSAGGGMHMRMHAAGCVTCHGVTRQGLRLMPKFWVVAPALTPAALFGEHDGDSADDGHGDHQFYDDATLRRAITEGIDPEGKRLDPAMPRWSMSESDLSDLVDFLGTPLR